MTREKALEAANLLYKLENIDNFLDEQCEQVSRQEDGALIAMMNDMQVLFELLNDKNRANSFSFEGGRGGDSISFDLYDWLVENDEGFLYDEYTYIYLDEGSELYVCYMRSDSFIHIEIGINEYVKHFIIELR